MTGLGAGRVMTIPVSPDGPEAQRWLQEELAKPPYAAARPSWFDRLSQSFFDWLGSLSAPTGNSFTDWVPVVVTVLVAAAVVVAWLTFGAPRRNRRLRADLDMFGAQDRRSAAEMRRAADVAALAENWSLASEEIFRALAAELSERTVVTVTPGTTAHAFADRASAAFPGERTRLAQAAEVFDQVRYLGAAGSEADFRRLAVLESDVRGLTPAVMPPVGGLVSS